VRLTVEETSGHGMEGVGSDLGNRDSKIVDNRTELSRSRRQGLRAVAAGLILEIIGAILSATRWVIYLGQGVEERPFYFGGIGDFLVVFGLVSLIAGGVIYLYYDDKLKQMPEPDSTSN